MAAIDAPEGLAEPGRVLWATITREFDLREDERQALVAACRTADEIERLEAVLVDAEPLVTGSTGQVKPHPLFAEVRAHRLALARLLQSVGLPEESAEGDDGMSRSRAASQLARRRWGTR